MTGNLYEVYGRSLTFLSGKFSLSSDNFLTFKPANRYNRNVSIGKLGKLGRQEAEYVGTASRLFQLYSAL